MLRHMVLALSSVVAFSAPLPAVTPNQQAAAHVFLVKMGKGDFSGLDRMYAPG